MKSFVFPCGGISPDEFKDIDLYVIDTVAPLSKMLTQVGGTLWFYRRWGPSPVGAMFYILEMHLESYLDGIACLTYILWFANLASDQIDQVIEFTSNSLWYNVGLASGGASDLSTEVQFATVSAFGVFADFCGINHLLGLCIPICWGIGDFWVDKDVM